MSYQSTHRFQLDASDREVCKDCSSEWPGADEPCARESEALTAALAKARRATPLGDGLAELEETLGLIENARQNDIKRDWSARWPMLFKALQADVQHVVDLLRDASVDLSEAKCEAPKPDHCPLNERCAKKPGHEDGCAQ